MKAFAFLMGAAALTIAWSDAATAQTAPAADDTTNGAAATQSDTGNDIVVTALRRNDNLMKTPIAASVLTGTDLANKGVVNVDALQFAMPSVVVNNFGQGLEFNIRGIGKAEHNSQTTTGVITYRDGVPTFPGYFQEEPYFDIANVQVLRGPQGTTVGQNSTGGAVFVEHERSDHRRRLSRLYPGQLRQLQRSWRPGRGQHPAQRHAGRARRLLRRAPRRLLHHHGAGLARAASVFRATTDRHARIRRPDSACCGDRPTGSRSCPRPISIISTSVPIRPTPILTGSRRCPAPTTPNPGFYGPVQYHRPTRREAARDKFVRTVLKVDYELNGGIKLRSISGFQNGNTAYTADLDGTAAATPNSTFFDSVTETQFSAGIQRHLAGQPAHHMAGRRLRPVEQLFLRAAPTNSWSMHRPSGQPLGLTGKSVQAAGAQPDTVAGGVRAGRLCDHPQAEAGFRWPLHHQRGRRTMSISCNMACRYAADQISRSTRTISLTRHHWAGN